ncbi:hypothetical protein PIB30_026344 [Stylosanthes scabra]|uniref:Uncharacterized protein n=1 Tax=Stylosanthes scabra TaxID=79078 RepID=A0ABU6YAV6_9FABA|nr:hypothetical protein [Stylosanthes scabra]
MFASHGRILIDQVMQLYDQVLETRTDTPGVDPSDLGHVADVPMMADPVDVVSPSGHTRESESGSRDDDFVLATPVGTRFLLAPHSWSIVDSHFHMLHLDAMEDERLINKRGGAGHMVVKNYSIRRAAECKVLESDSMKYCYLCK